MEPVTILMTGAGAPGAAGILKCLQEEPNFNIVAADVNENAVGKYLHKSFIQIPAASDNTFIPVLSGICLQHKIDVILPLVTKELTPLSIHREVFEKLGTRVMVSNANALAVANNKGTLYQFLLEKRIAVPKFKIIKGDAPDAIDALEQVIVSLGYPGKAVCFKPCIANGSRGFRIINPAIDEFDLLFNHKPDGTYILLADTKRILKDHAFPDLLVSEFLPGDEFSVDCIADNGKAILIVPRLRTKMRAGISVEGEFINDEAVIAYCKQIIEALSLSGNIGIQVKRNEQGEPLILEINPRVQGTIVAALGAGVNLPVLAVKQLLGHPMPNTTIRWGRKFSRYYTEVFY